MVENSKRKWSSLGEQECETPDKQKKWMQKFKQDYSHQWPEELVTGSELCILYCMSPGFFHYRMVERMTADAT